jgi:hypothetical protein
LFPSPNVSWTMQRINLFHSRIQFIANSRGVHIHLESNHVDSPQPWRAAPPASMPPCGGDATRKRRRVRRPPMGRQRRILFSRKPSLQAIHKTIRIEAMVEIACVHAYVVNRSRVARRNARFKSNVVISGGPGVGGWTVDGGHVPGGSTMISARRHVQPRARPRSRGREKKKDMKIGVLRRAEEVRGCKCVPKNGNVLRERPLEMRAGLVLTWLPGLLRRWACRMNDVAAASHLLLSATAVAASMVVGAPAYTTG